MTREDAVILFIVSAIAASLAVLLIAVSGCSRGGGQQKEKQVTQPLKLKLKEPQVSRRYWRRQQFRKFQKEQ